MVTDRRTDVTKLIDAFRNFANAPKNDLYRQGEIRRLKIGIGVKTRMLFVILLKLYSEYLAKEALEGFGDFKIGQVTRTVQYADDPVPLAK